MDTRASTETPRFAMPGVAGLPGARPVLWRALALVIGAAVAWLVFSAYGQPEFILDVAGLRLC